MISTLKNAWSIPELRKKLIFTALILLVYRLGNVIPVPYINADNLGLYYDTVLSDTVLGLYNAMSGSAFSQATVFALGIQPYINSSIIIQLLTIAIPALERLAKEGGEEGKKKINQITRFTTIGLGVLMGWAYYVMVKGYGGIITGEGFLPALVIILAFAAGSTVVMWLGEQITEFGIGNGISMILFANIISGIPRMVQTLFTMVWWQAVIVVAGMAAVILFIIFINDAERRIPIQYAKRVVGRKVYGGQNTNLPIKVAMSGVMPVIFASSICSIPATICAFTGVHDGWWYNHVWSSSSWFYVVMILFANIISGIPRMVQTLFTMVWWQAVIVVAGMAAVILFIIFINDAERRIPIQYAKRVVGRKVYGGQNTNLPIKVAMSGVMPVIFASSICSIPATICAFTGVHDGWWYNHVWSSSSWFYVVMYGLMIFFFSWFYSTIQYDPVEISNNLKKNGGFIPGFRPGRPTSDFIQKVINKIVIFGAVYLAIVALLPIVAGKFMSAVNNLAIGGTSVIIVVGVALETVKALEAQMMMRHYKGFLD